LKKIDLGQAVQLLANVGVLAGIVFLAVEIQQNTRSQEAITYQTLMQGIAALNEQRLAYPRVVPTIEGQYGATLQDLDPGDAERVEAFMFQVIRYADMAYYHYERGLLSEERLESAIGPLNGWRCLPIFQETWLGLRLAFVESYRRFVDQKMAEC